VRILPPRSGIGTPGSRRIAAGSALIEMIARQIRLRMSRMAYLLGPSVTVPAGPASQSDD